MSEKSRASAATQCAEPLDPSSSFFVRRGTVLASVVVVFAALAAYHNSFHGPFIFDDALSVTSNLTIRHLGSALTPLINSTTGGRPVLNLTFALNYALNGTRVGGYHVFNLLVHTLAGLVLFGIVRRTLTRPVLNGRFGTDSVPLALAVAVIWVVHPIQTEAVTYISQRAESLLGLFYLLSLYGFIRSAESFTPARWQILSILGCLLGAMSKEIIMTAPVMVLLYDRTFVAGSFREAWRQRWQYYLGLAACTWLLLAWLMTGLGQRSVGFGKGVTWWNYALTSCRSVVRYCQLAIWPHPLILDYGTNIVQHATEIAPFALALVVLLVVVAMALRYRPVIGFAGAWFFVILAPTSSVVPIVIQPMAEHRMYLSMAGAIALGVLGLHWLIGRRGLIACATVAVGLGWLTIQRNNDYRSALAIWSDTVAKCPDNERAHVSLGAVLAHYPGRLPDEIAEYQVALHIKPDFAEAHLDMGNALLRIPGRLPDAIAEYKTALRINPGYVDAHINLGNALLQIPGHVPDAIAEYKTVLRINPNFADAYYDVGCVLSQIPGRLPDAIAAYQAALRINPDQSEAHYNLGCALLQIRGRLPEAITEFEAALQINPDYADAHVNLGYALLQVPGHVPDAMAHFETALRIRPDFKEVRQELDRLRAHR
jgi:tetratricopeptide (TPR) repeat protein